jgi:type IV pilus assembly protein PilE
MTVPGRRHARTAPGPRRSLRWRAARGHTLLELLAALAIVACLAALASASYTHFLVAARRFDARAALTGLAAAQERHFLRHSSYATRLAAAGEDTSGGGPGSDGEEAPDALAGWHQSPQAHYRLAIGGADADDYRLEARPRGAQSRDRECAVFVLERSGLRSARSTSGADTTRRCWAGA